MKRKRNRKKRRAARDHQQQPAAEAVVIEPGEELEVEIDIAELDHQVEEQVAVVVAAAQAITIDSQETFEAAAAFLTEELKPALQEIERTFGPIVTAAHLAHKEALAQRRRHEQPLKDAERIVKAAIGIYASEQQEIARQAEQERLEAARKAAEDRAVEEAARLESDGHQEAAEERLAQPVAPVVTGPAPAAPKAAGISTRGTFDFEITDEGSIDRKFMTPDLKKIRAIVRGVGADAAELVGGIEVIERVDVAAKAR